ncbi:hypothetical protein LK994_13055 [Ferruginibacter lapsinanis]|uniref:hypothetical protein n=1 Tax=Ferruginibacter lapsinanis TaxID=563172 RepID=UPI001E62E5E3|nr:hypothetical protein [Ferruginibacter lapsinanis]UEG49563.1 hypothetical protein LK994_13055 [Ferruginibacter lapsinanis]
MKKLLLTAFLSTIFILSITAQNSLNSGDFVGGSWGAGQSMSSSVGGSLIITKSVSTSGDKYFRFYGDGTPCGEYQPNANGDPFTHSVTVTTPNGNCGGANAWKVNLPTASSNVVFKTDGLNTGISKSIAFVIQGTIQTVSSVAQVPTSGAGVYANQAVTVTATLSGSFATGQAVYLRYSTNSFSTSTVVAMTGSGTTYTGTIPAQAGGTTVQYYVFTSGSGTVGGSDGPLANGTDADFRTINLNNSGGSNYSYTVTAGNVFYWVGGTAPSNAFNDKSNWSNIGVGGSAIGASGANITFTTSDILIMDGSNVGSGATGPVSVAVPSSSSTVYGQWILRNNVTFKITGGGLTELLL